MTERGARRCGGLWRRCRPLALLCACVLLGWLLLGEARAGNPDLRWRTIETEHFFVHFHNGAEHTGKVTVLADNWQGKKLNAPNDAVVHPDHGAIWFTDPGYGSLMNYEGVKGKLEIKEAIYRIDAKTGKMDLVTDEICKPNGLCFSPDYKKLYVADTGASHYPDAPRNIKVWDVVYSRRAPRTCP